MGSVKIHLHEIHARRLRDSYVFTAAMPGIRHEDVEVALAGDQLLITGTSSSGRTFTRACSIPEDIDIEHAHAEARRGFVKVVVPRLPGPRPHNIQGGPPWFGRARWLKV